MKMNDPELFRRKTVNAKGPLRLFMEFSFYAFPLQSHNPTGNAVRAESRTAALGANVEPRRSWPGSSPATTRWTRVFGQQRFFGA